LRIFRVEADRLGVVRDAAIEIAFGAPAPGI